MASKDKKKFSCVWKHKMTRPTTGPWRGRKVEQAEGACFLGKKRVSGLYRVLCPQGSMCQLQTKYKGKWNLHSGHGMMSRAKKEAERVGEYSLNYAKEVAKYYKKKRPQRG
jgi:hypothetical protein